MWGRRLWSLLWGPLGPTIHVGENIIVLVMMILVMIFHRTDRDTSTHIAILITQIVFVPVLIVVSAICVPSALSANKRLLQTRKYLEGRIFRLRSACLPRSRIASR